MRRNIDKNECVVVALVEWIRREWRIHDALLRSLSFVYSKLMEFQ